MNKKSFLNLYFLNKNSISIKRIIFYSLLVFIFSQCEDLDTTKDFREENLLTLAFAVLPTIINNCPVAEFIVEKGKDYQIFLNKENSPWFQFSPNGNMTPPEEKRDYFLIVTKDSSASISLIPWTSCKNFSSPSTSGLTPHSETPTELKFKIEKASFQSAETNRYRLELNSNNQTFITIRQN
ncbi:hypothetical protein EHQ69_13830 [Leptospira congkakensis]|uniref:Uncharacterized protein n=1 Tax=Leptospira congkakensis TaxID=2484932 RepID=A0A8B5N8F6_9LEPT|nr:hypothetical protein EHQ69_13830 [Leptospira congkakensis]